MNTLFRSALLAAAVAAAAVTAGCQDPSHPTTRKEDAKLYDVTGTVVSLDKAKKVVTLDHQDIPGLMKGMTMEFAVEDAAVLDGLAAGDKVTGKLKADGGAHMVTSLKKQ
ncbi:MAG: copper-binding protein [Gemmataceae bacterium]